MKTLFVSLLAALSWFSIASSMPAGEADAAHVETIVGIRHGEKPSGNSLGQLTCRGLNRALALPKVLTTKYGRPNSIFAPDPAMTNHPPNSYVRPLMTIEPTAIWLTMPVNAQIGADDIQRLQQVLTGPAYEDSLIFIAWEHGNLDRFAKNLVNTYGGNPSIVPHWPSSDYDSIFVIRLTRSGGRTSVSFRHDQENLGSHLSDSCPDE
jgi:hypothetical protein